MQIQKRNLATVVVLIVCFAVLPVAEAQKKQARKKRKKRPPNPAFKKIEDDPKLPRVLLIGDSISIGYTVHVRKLMDGKANVHRAMTNCGPTTKGLKEIDKWLGKKRWDVIHFNWGLHDLKYMGAKGQNLADPKAKTSHQQVPPAEYEKNLRKLVGRLKKTKAKLVWCHTTPVPQGAKGRVVGHAVKFNAIATKVMSEYDVAVDDLYSYAKQRLAKIQLKANVHFTKGGSMKLAEQVARTIEKALE